MAKYKSVTVNQDEALVIKTDAGYADLIAKTLKEGIEANRPLIIILREGVDSYIVKKSNLSIDDKLLCKNCTYFSGGCWCKYFEYGMSENDFCSRGERREDGNSKEV